MTASAANANARSLLGAYAEGLRYFMGEGTLNTALAQVAEDLKRHGIDYMVIGAVAMLAHGYPRFFCLDNTEVEPDSSMASRFRVAVFCRDALKRGG